MAQATVQWRSRPPNGGSQPNATWTPGTDVDWDIPNEGMDIVFSSFYITGSLSVTQNGNPIGTEDIKYNPHTGIHGFWRQINTRVGQGFIENLNNYGHIVGQMSESSQFYQDEFSEVDKNMELRVGEENYTTQILRGQTAGDSAVSFAFKPVMALNFSYDAQGNPLNLSFGNLGILGLRTRLADVVHALYGGDASGAATTFALSDLQLWYRVVPAGPVPKATVFKIFNDIPVVINSNNFNIDVRMPGLTQTFSSTYISSADLSSYTRDVYRTSVLPDVTRVTFAYNGNDNVKIAFPLETKEEIQYNYRLSLGNAPLNSLLLSRTDAPDSVNSGFGIGLNFGQLRNLVQSTFSINILSSVQNVAPYTGFFFFRAMVTV